MALLVSFYKNVSPYLLILHLSFLSDINKIVLKIPKKGVKKP